MKVIIVTQDDGYNGEYAFVGVFKDWNSLIQAIDNNTLTDCGELYQTELSKLRAQSMNALNGQKSIHADGYPFSAEEMEVK